MLEAQLIAGSFEHALDVLIDSEIDLARLGARFCNDLTGAPAYNPAVMLKIVLLAYSRGVVWSRAIERLCRENVLCCSRLAASLWRASASSSRS